MHKASGPHGFCASHIKYMVKNFEWFSQMLANVFNDLLDDPNKVKDSRALYEFRAVFLPK